MDEVSQYRGGDYHTYDICSSELAPDQIDSKPSENSQTTCKPKCPVEQLPVKW